ncbi:MAG: hypothetical protein ACK4RK_03875 [Gemmataceae bacterium]
MHSSRCWKRFVPLSLLLVGLLFIPVWGQEGDKKKPAPDKGKTYDVLLKVDDRSVIPDVPRDQVICFCLYTTHRGILKLSAQLYPLHKGEEEKVTLEVQRDGQWKPIAQADVHPVGWTALFRVENWDMSQDVKYRVRHAGGASYEGLIRQDPVEKEVIVAAAFTGNSPGPGGGTLSKRDVVEYIQKINPDVLLFTGDQVYPHFTHTQHWLKFGEDFGAIIRDRPTVCIPDDHDVGQPNLWGQGGRKTDLDTKGGYTRPAEYVKMVERQQTAHLPDPYDPTPIEQGIGVYYTSLNVGGIDFAIIEDRKFKSGCYGLVTEKMGPRPDHITNPGFDPKQFDLPDKELLGDRQLKFLKEWGQNWDGAVMKAVVSQTVWSMASTYHARTKQHYYMDFDANGWPQTGRNQGVDALRRCFAFHINGDQHLATIVQYGIDDWRDAGWSFCVPSIANLYPRWWIPKQPGKNREPGADEHTGDYLDGFGNKLTVYAHTNPRETGREPAELHDRMPGYGIIRFDKKKRELTMECWPRLVDPTDPKSKQYTGWPRTIHQYDNYGRKAVAYLPTIEVRGQVDPVVSIIDEGNGEVVYTVRIQGTTFRPKVFREGKYTVQVGEGKNVQVHKGVRSMDQDSKATLPVNLKTR